MGSCSLIACWSAVEGSETSTISASASFSASVVTSPHFDESRPSQRITGELSFEDDITEDDFNIVTCGRLMFSVTFAAVASCPARGVAGCESRGLVENRRSKRSKRGVLGGSDEPVREFSNKELSEVTSSPDGIGCLVDAPLGD